MRTVNDETYPFKMHKTHNRIPQKVSVKRMRRGVRDMARTGSSRVVSRRVRFLPARDGKQRANAWVPPKRAIRCERRKVEKTCGQWENEQRVDERCHARLPINCNGNGQDTRPFPRSTYNDDDKGV